MLTPFVYAFRIAFEIILATTIAIGMSYEQECSFNSITNNKTAQGRLWNHSNTLGIPLGMHLTEIDGNRVQSGTHHGMRQSESVPSGKIISSW